MNVFLRVLVTRNTYREGWMNVLERRPVNRVIKGINPVACSEIIEALQAAVGPGLNLSSNLQRMCAFIRPSAMPAQATGIFFL